jgi:NAD(P)-dependent dehydrogenase (short-subunit alcohol dehydrogenase family)
MGELTGQVVLITGASGGLGGAVTQAFREAGAELAETPDARADLTVPAEAARLAEQVQARWGRLDALVHLVGGFEGGSPVAQTEDRVWRRMLDLNLNTAFYMARAVLPEMMAAGHGRILAIGSRTALDPVATLSAYGVSKAALIALIRTIALEVKGTRITANAVLPSVIDTAANRAANPGADCSRWVRPEAIAQLLVWLASDAAADVNGAAIPIYGGA